MNLGKTSRSFLAIANYDESLFEISTTVSRRFLAIARNDNLLLVNKGGAEENTVY
jgi:hypothetical protein